MAAITRASERDVDDVATLFDAYRQFYDQPADLAAARDFIASRVSNNESVIYLARNKSGEAVGFTQLYPSFCSVAARSVWILYDLFVAPAARRQGVAVQLMNRARDHAMETGAAWLKLETALTNKPAQALYESLGWVRDDDFYVYYLRPGDQA
ncbi:MAG: GNAT family N-acetyltransferase [Parvularculaceae bacterium]